MIKIKQVLLKTENLTKINYIDIFKFNIIKLMRLNFLEKIFKFYQHPKVYDIDKIKRKLFVEIF